MAFQGFDGMALPAATRATGGSSSPVPRSGAAAAGLLPMQRSGGGEWDAAPSPTGSQGPPAAAPGSGEQHAAAAAAAHSAASPRLGPRYASLPGTGGVGGAAALRGASTLPTLNLSPWQPLQQQQQQPQPQRQHDVLDLFRHLVAPNEVRRTAGLCPSRPAPEAQAVTLSLAQVKSGGSSTRRAQGAAAAEGASAARPQGRSPWSDTAVALDASSAAWAPAAHAQPPQHQARLDLGCAHSP